MLAISIILFCISAGILFVSKIKFKIGYFSPPFVFFYVNFVSCVLGYFFYDSDATGLSVVLDSNVGLYGDILQKIAVVLCFFSTGLFCYSYFSESLKKVVIIDTDFFKIISNEFVFYGAFISVVIYIFGNGVSEFFYRQDYMVENIKEFKVAGTYLCLIFSFLLGEKFSSSRNWINVLIACVILVSYACYSSRTFAIAVLLFGVGASASKRGGFIKVATLAVTVALAPLFLFISLCARGMREQGLFPLVGALFESSIPWQDFNFSILLNNTLLGNFPITVLTVFVGDFNFGYILTSLNPLPGFLTDWYDINSGINVSTPFSAMGEIIGYGVWFACLFYMLLGVGFGWVERNARRGDWRFIIGGRAFLYIYCVTAMQYTTRASFRFIYYFLFFLCISKIFSLFKGGVKGK